MPLRHADLSAVVLTKAEAGHERRWEAKPFRPLQTLIPLNLPFHDMCFSAEASFAASAALAATGLSSVVLAKTKKIRLVALIPLAFSVQQAIEGFQWLTPKPRIPLNFGCVKRCFLLSTLLRFGCLTS